jgi:hypothetical protein
VSDVGPPSQPSARLCAEHPNAIDLAVLMVHKLSDFLSPLIKEGVASLLIVLRIGLLTANHRKLHCWVINGLVPNNHIVT